MTLDAAIVLAGGEGSRLWPWCRRHRPKPTLNPGTGPSLLAQNLELLAPLVPRGRVWVVTDRESEALLAKVSELEREAFLVEPEPRGTAAAVALGVARARAWGARTVAVLPADGRVRDVGAMRRAITDAVHAADEGLVLLGQQPDAADEGLGYIVPASQGSLSPVRRFVEKPEHAYASTLIEQGALWNMGWVVGTADGLAGALQRHLPEVGALEDEGDLRARWPALPELSFDRGVLEREEALWVRRCAVGWRDVGTWGAMAAEMPRGVLGAQRVAEAVAVDAGALVVHAPDRVVAALGVRNLVLVDDGEILMVCDRSQAHRIPELRHALYARGRDDLT